MAGQDFIELGRQFVGFDPRADGERDDLTYSLGSYFDTPKNWKDVLENRCTVIIAEAGTGKTEELRHQALALRSAAQAAFFCRLDLLVTFPLAQAIEIGTGDEFRRWQDGTSQGYFFLDSVDEAKLANPADFERAVLKFVEAVEANKDRATVVISTRPNAWLAYADREMVSARLGLAPPAKPTVAALDPDMGAGEDDFAELAETEDDGKGRAAPPAVVVLKLAPLSREQVRVFARARNVSDIDAFMNALERADADVFANRPADLPGLIAMWQKERRIGRYSDVVLNNIQLKLQEANPAHQYDTIATDRAMTGAEALAAAVTFCQRTSILLPDRQVGVSLAQNSLDPGEVLVEWTPDETRALLGRALFDESLYGTVRFHHRTAREYLSAQWLGHLLIQRKNRRSIEKLLFAKPYGSEAEVVVPSMKPIAAWLATKDQGIRDRIMRVDPKILLEHGDASALDVGTRATLLRDLAARYRNRKHTPISVNIRELRRLADPALTDVARELLTTYGDHHDVRQLMLRIIREGRVPDCGDLAETFALDHALDSYTQAMAIQAVGYAGTSEQKSALATAILANPAAFDSQALAAAIESLPAFLSITNLVAVIAGAAAPGTYSLDYLEQEFESLIGKLTKPQEIELLSEIVALLSSPPVHEPNYCRISRRFDWLIPIASQLTRRIVQDNNQACSNPDVLTVLSMSEQVKHLERYTSDAQKIASECVRDNRDLKHALFWYEAEQARLRSGKPVQDWWFAINDSNIEFLEDADFGRFERALAHRSLFDDKLVALSALVAIYNRQNQDSALLERIEQAVAGDAALEQALAKHLAPAQLSSAQIEAEERRAAWAKSRKAEERQNTKAREDWIAGLQADRTKVGDLALVPEGKIWNNTGWLMDEVRKKSAKSSRLGAERWDLLEPEFGREVAEAFHKYCLQFWRLYKPALRSELGGSSSSISRAIILGLSGLGMEARSGPDWATKLSKDEVDLAARYALQELNGLPPWVFSLYQAHPQEVAAILRNEMEWELSTPPPANRSGYVLSSLRWTDRELAQALRPDVISLVEAHSLGEVHALSEAITVILRDPSPVTQTFVEVAGCRAEEAIGDEYKALWLAALLCLDASRAVTALESWVNAGRCEKESETRITSALEHVWGDDFHGFQSQHSDFLSPSVLLRLLKLTHQYVRIEADISHDEVYSPGPRDHAQQARGNLLELLFGLPGRDTYDALIELSHFHSHQYAKDRMLVLAEQRAEADTDLGPWSPGEVVGFTVEAERNPATQKDLFDLACSRLDDLKLDFEEGDESEASLLRKVEDEPELRRALANRLKQMAREKYTTGSEEELADDRRTDIRLHNPRVDARIPIEVKIAGRWSGTKLRERLETQLAGQYMREARYGVFLLVNRAGENERKRWKIHNRIKGFDDLISWLGEEARSLAAGSSTIEGLEVVGIDLTKRDGRQRLSAGSTKSPRAT